MKKITVLKEEVEETLGTQVKKENGYADRYKDTTLAWVKSVTGVDKTKNNGYCLVGEFVNDNTYTINQLYVALINNYQSGKYTNKFYILFYYNNVNELVIEKIIYNKFNGSYITNTKRNWAVELIPFVEGFKPVNVIIQPVVEVPEIVETETVEEVNDIVDEIINRIQNELIEIDSLAEEEKFNLTEEELDMFFLKNCRYGGDDEFTLMLDIEDLIPTDLIEEYKNMLDDNTEHEPELNILNWWHKEIKNKLYDRLKEVYEYEYEYLHLDFGSFEGLVIILDEKYCKISRYEDK